jgi:hypothetical protein
MYKLHEQANKLVQTNLHKQTKTYEQAQTHKQAHKHFFLTRSLTTDFTGSLVHTY